MTTTINGTKRLPGIVVHVSADGAEFIQRGEKWLSVCPECEWMFWYRIGQDTSLISCGHSLRANAQPDPIASKLRALADEIEGRKP